MEYKTKFKPRAIKDCKSIDKKRLKLIFSKIELLSDNLQGDVKQLTNFTPEYRLRVGDYRVLFETEKNEIIIYRIMHRKAVYRWGGSDMIKLNAKILEKNGEKEFAVIPYEEFVKIQEELEDYESLKALREAKSKEPDADTTSFDEVKKQLELE